eukprot:GHVL01024352.1.p1 GENE.GHVL01024352.1~~GHVL01024352.1.p1  ORF type:complete len:154 (+),score=11.83 GHVL01024352.1:51-512(+)
MFYYLVIVSFLLCINGRRLQMKEEEEFVLNHNVSVKEKNSFVIVFQYLSSKRCQLDEEAQKFLVSSLDTPVQEMSLYDDDHFYAIFRERKLLEVLELFHQDDSSPELITVIQNLISMMEIFMDVKKTNEQAMRDASFFRTALVIFSEQIQKNS